jgi:putative membrane protein
MRFIALSWLANVISLWIVAWIFSGVTYDGFSRLVVAGAIFGVLNTVLKPLLLVITLPLAIVTLGIAWFGVAMLMLHLTDGILRRFDIHGFWTLAGATVLVWIVNTALDNFGPWHGTRGRRGRWNVEFNKTRFPNGGV